MSASHRTQSASRIAYERLLAASEDGRISNATPADGRISNATYPSSDRIAMDGGHADVETVETAVELTVTLAERAVLGIALSPAEARRIGEALVSAAHRAHVAQAAHVDLEGVDAVTDLFRRSQEIGIPASALVEVTR
ncbi:hypothetical protein ACTXPS_16515 [Brachybacterium tyrofermentans]|uniref:hypothetical protein n=1 Tax=Brachybacterium tyrofermentans TaxID=47848 RepID=UPI003FD5FDC4